jgi:hypothetical protein
VAEATNFDAIHSLLPHVPCYRFPWVDRWEDPDALAAAAEGTHLADLLRPLDAQGVAAGATDAAATD